jgi:hypothetical protein
MGTSRVCRERYDEVATAPADRVALLERWRGAAGRGDRATLAAAIDRPRAEKVNRALGQSPARPEDDLLAVLARVPSACEARWVGQDGRMAIQPSLDVADPVNDAGIEVLGESQQFVLACGGCGTLVVALVGDQAVAWGSIP